MNTSASIASRRALGSAHRTITSRITCTSLHLEPTRFRVLQTTATTNAYSTTRTPTRTARPTSSSRRVHRTPDPPRSESLSRKTLEAPSGPPKKGVKLDERRDSLFGRFLAWAESKNKQYERSAAQAAKELEDMEALERKAEAKQRVQEAKQKLKNDLGGGK